MRIDKYLKVSRLIKRRTVAKEVIEAGRVTINGRIAKPGSEVKVGDVLVLGFGPRQIRVEVLDLKDSASVEEAKNLYRTLE